MITSSELLNEVALPETYAALTSKYPVFSVTPEIVNSAKSDASRRFEILK